MDNDHSNKRLKSASGAPIKIQANGSNLAAYQPPAAVKQHNGDVIGLTVKAPPSKLRQATSGSQIESSIPPNPYADNASESDATPQPAARTARATRNPRTVVEPESDEEDKEEELELEDEEMEDRPEDSEEDAAGSDESEGNENGEGDNSDQETSEMEDELHAHHPPPPIIKQERPPGKVKPNVTVTAPPEGPMKSVEAKEMEFDSNEEEELSELDSNEDEGEDSEGSGSEDEDNSRSATPDLSKLTRRQRGAYEEVDESNLMALSNEAQKKKHLTAEEHAMRRAEMARRRKNLSEKRNEEEKMDTINKLLKKPAPKRRTRAEIIAAQQMESMATPGAEEGEEERPDPLFVRWVNNSSGSRIGVPEEWLEAPVGEIFVRPGGLAGGRMVEEVA